MPVTVEWDNPTRTIIRQHLTPGIRFGDLYCATEHLYRQIAAQAHSVSIIVHVECSADELITAGLFNFLAQVNPCVSENTGRIAVVNRGMMLPTLLPVARLIAPHIARRTVFCHNIAEARASLSNRAVVI